MTILSRCVALAAAVIALSGAEPPQALAQLASFAKSELTILTASGEHRIAIEEAKTADQMAQGLMFRRSLPADAGMLFEYDHPQPVSFWMKNTLIPLDMVFIGEDGRVVRIHERAVPLSLDPIGTEAPVRAVLELNGGAAARLGIKPGDRIDHPLFAKRG